MQMKWILPLLLLGRSALACPFCDVGGLDAAFFILVVLLPFAASMLLFLLAARKAAKAFPPSESIGSKVFEAERSSAHKLHPENGESKHEC